ncbi:ABC transporter ATP-binding protein [Enterococcus pallens]|uniref:ABC transporter ATP-binding protein/permease n=1 Tax=Enterococcus pallens ATCC BAA-351 TaxID=1158607 RepID=R2Q173_9ENTE|nr:ABC transporter ATP-binding protein [Enterococcus pallens]EOH90317.1 hypothetical protein UAU_04146 [Enterococcus pallens ATCC BAA-351]EOU15077.1 hypothetical protein I588_04009 [Enterococcus pallens ATCC BAA-351]
MSKKNNMQTAKNLLRVLKYMIKNYKLLFSITVLCIISSAVISMYGMLFVRDLIDIYITPLLQGTQNSFQPLLGALVKLSCIFVLGILTNYAYNLITVRISQGAMKKLRNDLFDKMESLPIEYFDTHPHGDIMSVYTNDIDTLRQLMGQSIPQMINVVVTIVATFISMMLINIQLTIFTLLIALIMVVVTSILSKKSSIYFNKQQENIGALDGYIEEMLDGQKVVKIFNHENQAINDFREYNHSLRDSTTKANTFANIMMPINGNIGNLSYIICIIVGALLTFSGSQILTIGDVIAFIGLNKSFTQPFMQISQQMNAIIMAAAGSVRVFELIDETPEIDNGYVELVPAQMDSKGNLVESNEKTGDWLWKHYHKATDSITYTELKGNIEFEHVDFGYTKTKKILHDINLYAKPGQKLAFVGATGAGKTTITNLINRFYDIQGGKLRYDGINIEKIKKSALRKRIGVVLQDTNLFTGTVLDNIRYGNPDATDKDCIEAAKLANADDFINLLPEGYNTILKNNGSSLSQGQRQLLSIARAAAANAPVLILDEATSSIDSRTEKAIQSGMDALMKGRTTFVIAHRLSTIKNSDCIMVMDKGRIIERGTHEDLINTKGQYYRLYTGNFAE